MRGMMIAHQLLLLLTLIPSNPNKQVFNMVNIPDKEKSTTTTMKGNEPDQSN